jgi:membrane-associated phospholipid phosphatase
MRAHTTLAEILKAPGTYGFTVCVAVAVTLLHPLGWRATVFTLLATLVSGVNGMIKWMVGRTRPFKLDANLAQPFVLSPFRGGWHGTFESKNLCFPSGHAALAFATAGAVAMLWPKARWRWGAYVIATIVAAERVAENAHWLSDTVAAAALGIGGVHLIAWLLRKLLTQPAKESATVS